LKNFFDSVVVAHFLELHGTRVSEKEELDEEVRLALNTFGRQYLIAFY